MELAERKPSMGCLYVLCEEDGGVEASGAVFGRANTDPWLRGRCMRLLVSIDFLDMPHFTDFLRLGPRALFGHVMMIFPPARLLWERSLNPHNACLAASVETWRK